MAESKNYLRCAIYTRKSSEEGLEQDFNSLHAQREACEAFILSQKHEGWHLIRDAYDDGGISGGTMERPALQRLLSDIKNRLVDVIVVYKVDRLTRSLADFARMVELFDSHKVSFVSVTQQFNTTSSMGRLTLNVLLSFAQFEREVTSERIRDKFKASKQKGIFMGGTVPLGYDVKERRLLIVESEAKMVREVFTRYLTIKNIRLLRESLTVDGYRTKIRPGQKRQGGQIFSRGALRQMLANPLYIGKIKHKDKVYDGLQEAIIPQSLWNEVQELLSGKAIHATRKESAHQPNLLLGKLYDESGTALSTNYANKKDRRYRYYISRQLKNNVRKSAKNDWRLPAQELENLVASIASEMLHNQSIIASTLNEAGMSPHLIPSALQIAHDAGIQIKLSLEMIKIFEQWVKRVDLTADGVCVTLTLAEIIQTDQQGSPVTITHSAPLFIKRRGVEMRLITKPHGESQKRIDTTLVKTIARAHCWFEDLATGKAGSITEIAQREGVGKSYVGDLLKLAFLSPKLVESIISGNQPVTLVADHLIKQPVNSIWD